MPEVQFELSGLTDADLTERIKRRRTDSNRPVTQKTFSIGTAKVSVAIVLKIVIVFAAVYFVANPTPTIDPSRVQLSLPDVDPQSRKVLISGVTERVFRLEGT